MTCYKKVVLTEALTWERKLWQKKKLLMTSFCNLCFIVSDKKVHSLRAWVFQMWTLSLTWYHKGLLWSRGTCCPCCGSAYSLPHTILKSTIMYHKYFPTQFDELFSFKKFVKLQFAGVQVNLTSYFQNAISLKNPSNCKFRELKSIWRIIFELQFHWKIRQFAILGN